MNEDLETAARPEARRPAPAAQEWSISDAARSSPGVIVTMFVVLAVLGVVAGMVRTPKYTATAVQSVLHLNFGVPGALSGFSTASAALADTYARAIHADGVTGPLAQEFHTSAGTIRTEISAVAVPNSPVFTVTAAAATGHAAVALANAASTQLEKYIESVNASSPDGSRLLSDLTRAEVNAAVREQTVNRLKSGVAQKSAALGPARVSATDRAVLATAQAAANVAQDEVLSLKVAYQQSVVGQAATQFLQPLQAAVNPASDKKAKAELFGFAGAAVGLALGLLIAVLRYRRRPQFRV